ncbi:hypothetical protein, partial [Micromonospora tarensis]|uniref:hypothetical protein n=1 Tax=Micromonospora tarensis TaxID=2806100 RepID=UPI001EE3B2FA
MAVASTKKARSGIEVGGRSVPGPVADRDGVPLGVVRDGVGGGGVDAGDGVGDGRGVDPVGIGPGRSAGGGGAE